MLRERGIVTAVLKYVKRQEATASQVLKHFKIHYSANQRLKEKEEAIISNLDSFLTLLQGECLVTSKSEVLK